MAHRPHVLRRRTHPSRCRPRQPGPAVYRHRAPGSARQPAVRLLDSGARRHENPARAARVMGPMVRVLGSDGTVGASTADVIWVYRRRRRQWLAEWQRGEGSSEFFYGLLSLRARYRVGFVEDEGRGPFGGLWYPLERLITQRLGMGFALDLALRNLAGLNRARIVISTVDACGLPLAFLKAVGLLKTPLIYISQGLSDRVATYGADRRLARRYRRFLLGPEQLLTPGPGRRTALAALPRAPPR